MTKYDLVLIIVNKQTDQAYSFISGKLQTFGSVMISIYYLSEMSHFRHVTEGQGEKIFIYLSVSVCVTNRR